MLSSDRLRQIANAAASAAISISRPNYFESNNSRGENYEIRNDLNSEIPIIRKEAVKKVIANMTVGKDASSLFPDVVKCMQTEDLEMKKLVYLYLMNYAKSQPELVILAINTFCKDTEDPNPLIRALALRTMGCIRVEQIFDYIIEPLRRCLRDENPYVRKTAAICVAKVFNVSPGLAEECGFLEMLQSMLTDSNPMVVSNAVAALTDIQAILPHQEVLVIDSRISIKLLTALNEATEWGQISILDALSTFTPETMEDLEIAIEKILPRLQHINPGVVLSTVKVLLRYTEALPEDNNLKTQMPKKLAPPLVTLLSSPPEIQYVVLRNLCIILHKHRSILEHGVRVFFCKYNDPLYVKLEKIRLIELMVDENNGEQVISELVENAKEIDVDFVKRAIKAIGTCTLQVPKVLVKSSTLLFELAQSEINYVLDEIVITTRMLLRKYPGELDELCGLLGEKAESFDEDEARAAGLWIIGEYYNLCPNYFQILRNFAETVVTEAPLTQSELISTLFKVLLRDFDQIRPLLDVVLEKLTKQNENADLRDRAIQLGRILELKEPQIRAFIQEVMKRDGTEGKGLRVELLDADLVNVLIEQLSLLSSVLHIFPDAFSGDIPRAAMVKKAAIKGKEGDVETRQGSPMIADLLDLGLNGAHDSDGTRGTGGTGRASVNGGHSGNGIVDDGLASKSAPAEQLAGKSPQTTSLLDLLGDL